MVKAPTDEKLCLRCKGGKYLCGLTYCPILIRTKALIPVRKLLPKLKSSYFGPSPPSLFVGRYGYPDVRIGPMGAIDWDNITIIDEPDLWKTGMTLQEIVSLRAKLFRFMGDPVNIKWISDPKIPKLLEITREQVQASSPVDLEVKFSKKPQLNLSFNQFTQPMGARVNIDSIELASSPKINFKIERIVSDTDLHATSAINSLYSDKSSVTQISRIFSAGLLGTNKRRKFVPTRWSITAVDDTIGNNIRNIIKDFPEVQDYTIYYNSYLDNDFWILFLPERNWFFDYHEAWKQESAWNLTGETPSISSDYEGAFGRKTYASNTVGGYYAARLAILERLFKLKRKAAVLAIREVGKGYAIPLGVWQVRENVRQALKQPIRSFTDLNAALDFISPNLTIPMQYYRRKSPILNQKTLNEFFYRNK